MGREPGGRGRVAVYPWASKRWIMQFGDSDLSHVERILDYLKPSPPPADRPTSDARASLGSPNPLERSSGEIERDTSRPTPNLARSRTHASYARGGPGRYRANLVWGVTTAAVLPRGWTTHPTPKPAIPATAARVVAFPYPERSGPGGEETGCEAGRWVVGAVLYLVGRWLQ
jgi:hypothetical protein